MFSTEQKSHSATKQKPVFQKKTGYIICVFEKKLASYFSAAREYWWSQNRFPALSAFYKFQYHLPSRNW